MKDKKEYNLDDRDVVILPITYDHGFRLNWVKFKRKLFKKRWEYSITVFFALIFMSCGILIAHVYYSKLFINAATYGFLQSTWDGGADTGAVALHDTNQENYNKYYSKDDNITLLNSGEDISLINSSSTIAETSISDFTNGSFNNTSAYILSSDDKLSLQTCNENSFRVNDYTYCLANSCMSISDCRVWYEGYWGSDKTHIPNCSEALNLINSGNAHTCNFGIFGNGMHINLYNQPNCTISAVGGCPTSSQWCIYTSNCAWIIR